MPHPRSLKAIFENQLPLTEEEYKLLSVMIDSAHPVDWEGSHPLTVALRKTKEVHARIYKQWFQVYKNVHYSAEELGKPLEACPDLCPDGLWVYSEDPFRRTTKKGEPCPSTN